VPVGPFQQLAERRQGPGRHDLGVGRRRHLDPLDHELWLLRQPHFAACFAEKRGFARVRFDQGDIEVWPHCGDYQSREPAAAPQIGKRFGNRDHTTVIHAVKTIDSLRTKENELNHDLHVLLQVLKG